MASKSRTCAGLVLGASITALMWAGVAEARDVATNGPTEGVAAARPEAPLAGGGLQDADQDADTAGVEDIVVTAQRRDERLQDVPIAVSVVTAIGAERAGISTTEALGVAVPALQFSRSTTNGGVPYIRGVGTTSATQGSQSPVAVYVDDVYIATASASMFGFNNISQVEVLKGPQGTLFGRNATGGVVHVQTKKPSHDASMDATFSYGNYDTVEASAYATGGLTDTLAVSFAGVVRYQDEGYGLDVTTGEEVYKSRYYGARGQLLWMPGPDTSVLLSADYMFIDDDAGGNTTILPGTVASGGGTFPGRYRTRNNPADWAELTQYGFSAKVQHDFQWANLVSISAYRRAGIENGADLDGSAVTILSARSSASDPSYSQEVRLSAPTDSPIQWIVGGMYFETTDGQDPAISIGTSQNANGGRTYQYNKQNLKSYAGFGEVNGEILPNLKVTLGLRYTADYFKFSVLRTNNSGTPLAPTPFTREKDWSKLTYRAVVDYHFTPDVMAYASYSRGFHSGGFNLSSSVMTVNGVVVPAPEIAPEVLDAWEAGVKAEFFDRRLRLNLSAFKYDYTNLQVSTTNLGQSLILNAAGADIKGLDMEFEARPFRGLTLSGGMSFLDSVFTVFPAGPYFVPQPAVCTPVPRTTGTPTGGNLNCPTDLAGYRTPRAPKFTASLSATYSVETNAGTFAATGTVYHNAGFAWDADNVILQPDYTLLNGSISWTVPDGSVELRLWGRNLTDTYYASFATNGGQRASWAPAAPRTYGIAAGFHF